MKTLGLRISGDSSAATSTGDGASAHMVHPYDSAGIEAESVPELTFRAHPSYHNHSEVSLRI